MRIQGENDANNNHGPIYKKIENDSLLARNEGWIEKEAACNGEY
jgi:hypothetical protein